MNNLNKLEARGVEPLFPAYYVQQRPRMLYQSHFGGEYVFMEKDGRTRMLLVSLLGDKRLKTCGGAVLDHWFP
jgi:hypothetical protein